MSLKQVLLISGFFVLFALIIILRFWKVPEMFFFGIDEEYSSLLALSIIKDFHIIWIGLSAANTGFYVGPGVIYIHSFLLWLSKLDPIILAYIASFIGVVNSVIFYLAIKKLFDKKIAFISTTVYSLSSLVIMYDRRFWNSSFVPLMAILFYYSLAQLKKDFRWLIAVVALIAISFHIHASLFIFIPIAIYVSIYRYIETKPKISLITSLISVFIFLAIYSPLIVFDFVHNFDNLKTPLRMWQNLKGSGGEPFIMTHIKVFFDTVGSFLFPTFHQISQHLNILLSFLILLLILKFIFSKKIKQKHFVFITIVIFYLLLFLFYPGRVLDYYYLGFFPFLAVIIAQFLSHLKYIYIIPIILIYIFFSINIVIKQPLNTGIKYKKDLIQKTLKFIQNDSYYLATDEIYLYFGGWRYLFEAYGKKPVASDADQMFGWIYQKEISPDMPKYRVYITQGKFDPLQPVLFKTSSGIYHVNIVKFIDHID